MFGREFRLRLKTAWAVEALEKQASASSEVLRSAGREDFGKCQDFVFDLMAYFAETQSIVENRVN